MLSEKEIKHIARLARMELDNKTEKKLRSELSLILDYVEQLNQVNTDNAEPLYQTTGLANQIRSDEYRGDFIMDDKLNEFLIGQAPHKHERFIKVKSVLKK